MHTVGSTACLASCCPSVDVAVVRWRVVLAAVENRYNLNLRARAVRPQCEARRLAQARWPRWCARVRVAAVSSDERGPPLVLGGPADTCARLDLECALPRRVLDRGRVAEKDRPPCQPARDRARQYVWECKAESVGMRETNGRERTAWRCFEVVVGMDLRILAVQKHLHSLTHQPLCAACPVLTTDWPTSRRWPRRWVPTVDLPLDDLLCASALQRPVRVGAGLAPWGRR